MALPPLEQRIEHPPVILSDSEMHYLAGLFDGEGTICILRSPGTQRRPTPKYDLRVGIVMTHLASVQRFRDLFGGSAVGIDARLPKIKHRWAATAWVALRCLVALGPALRVKRRQAEVAAEFMDTFRVENRGRNLIDTAVFLERERLAEALGAMNDSHWHRKRLLSRK